MTMILQVEVKAMWLGGKEEKGVRDKMVDKVMGVRKPTFKRPFNPTKLNGNYLYHSISMMMASGALVLVFLLFFLFCFNNGTIRAGFCKYRKCTYTCIYMYNNNYMYVYNTTGCTCIIVTGFKTCYQL